MDWRCLAVLSVSGAAVLAGCGHGTAGFAAPSVADACRIGRGITASTTTKSYLVRLDVGPVETMYTQAEADAQHPAQGELVLRGALATVPGDAGATGSTGYHLEAHLCSKAGGASIQNAQPTISLANDAAANASQVVPVAVLQGVGSDASDIHYGNNVVLASGGWYTVTVSLNGETAILRVQVPRASSTATVPSNHMTDMSHAP